MCMGFERTFSKPMHISTESMKREENPCTQQQNQEERREKGEARREKREERREEREEKTQGLKPDH